MYTLETRTQAISAYAEGKSVKTICDSFGISRSCLYNWVKLYTVRKDKNMDAEYSYSQILSLQKQITKLTREYKVLQ